MKAWMRWMVGALALGLAGHAAAELVFYEGEDFRGRSFIVDRPVADFFNYGYNDRASSVAVRSGSWELCSDANFRGRCVTVTPGDYRSLAAIGLDNRVSSARAIAGPPPAPVPPGPPRAGARLTLFATPNFVGRPVTIEGDVANFDQLGMNDRAYSAIVEGATWQVCEHAEYRGSCVSLGPGRYPDLGALNGMLSSARVLPPMAGTPAAPAPRPGARVVLYGQRDFRGRALTVDQPIVRNLADLNFNDRASSLRVEDGYWLFCSDADFEGECRTFGPGEYASLPGDLQNRISSARRISNRYPYREAPNWRGY